MSAAQAGHQVSAETRKKISAAMADENNFWYGKVATNAMAISVYTLDGEFVQSFPSHSEAAKFLGVSQPCISRAICRGFTVKGLYRVVNTNRTD